jgi:hypothetical protein
MHGLYFAHALKILCVCHVTRPIQLIDGTINLNDFLLFMWQLCYVTITFLVFFTTERASPITHSCILNTDLTCQVIHYLLYHNRSFFLDPSEQSDPSMCNAYVLVADENKRPCTMHFAIVYEIKRPCTSTMHFAIVVILFFLSFSSGLTFSVPVNLFGRAYALHACVL